MISTAAPAMPPLDSRKTEPGEICGGSLVGIDSDLLARLAGHGAGDRRAVAGADERLEAGERRPARILARELDLAADVAADVGGERSSASFMASER